MHNDSWYVYPLIAGALSSPWWAQALEQANLVLTFITLAGGLVLLAFKISEYIKKDKKHD